MTPDIQPPPSPSAPEPTADELDTADMARLATGHDAALNELMERHSTRMFRFLCRMLGNVDDANDLAQETFVRVYQHRTAFRSGACFSTWLYTIAANLARNRLRWRARHPSLTLETARHDGSPSLGDTLSDGRPTPPETMAAGERVNAIRDAVAELPEELRTPLLLAEYEDLPQKEIAAVLSCSVKAVETRIHRARQQLRTRLKSLL